MVYPLPYLFHLRSPGFPGPLGWCLVQGRWGAAPGDSGQACPLSMALLALAQVQGEVLPSSKVKL